jgi:hypothetical protein
MAEIDYAGRDTILRVMEEYKYIQIRDDSDPSNAKVKALVDKMASMPTAYIYSIQRIQGNLTITWNMWKPSGAGHEWFKRQALTLTDSESITNVVATQFRLPPSLENALAQLAASPTAEAPANINSQDGRALWWWRLIDATFDQECVGQTPMSQSNVAVWFRETLRDVRLTPAGKKYLAMKALTELPRAKSGNSLSNA